MDADAVRSRIAEARAHINAIRDHVGDLAGLRAADVLLKAALDELPAPGRPADTTTPAT